LYVKSIHIGVKKGVAVSWYAALQGAGRERKREKSIRKFWFSRGIRTMRLSKREGGEEKVFWASKTGWAPNKKGGSPKKRS